MPAPRQARNGKHLDSTLLPWRLLAGVHDGQRIAADYQAAVVNGALAREAVPADLLAAGAEVEEQLFLGLVGGCEGDVGRCAREMCSALSRRRG